MFVCDSTTRIIIVSLNSMKVTESELSQDDSDKMTVTSRQIQHVNISTLASGNMC